MQQGSVSELVQVELWGEESWADGAVVDRHVVLRHVVAQVGGTGAPVVAELALKCFAT